MSVEPERGYEPAYFLDQVSEYMAQGMSPKRARAEAYRRLPFLYLRQSWAPNPRRGRLRASGWQRHRAFEPYS